MIESTSFTPPTRQLSTWQKPIAPACRSCLKMTRFWQASPVATRMGATSRAMAAWPSTSSGEVGSSIHQGSNSARLCICRIASGTSQHWLASIISLPLGPMMLRMSPARRRFISRSWPTFILRCVQPAATASSHRRRTLSSE